MGLHQQITDVGGPLVEKAGGPVMMLLGGTLSVQGVTNGLNLATACVGLVVAVLGAVWTYYRIQIAKHELREKRGK